MDGTVCGRCGSQERRVGEEGRFGWSAAQAIKTGNSWIRPGGSASACASMAAAAVATCAVTGAGPDTGASARCPGSAVVITVVAEAREGDGSGGDATRAAGPGADPFAAIGALTAAVVDVVDAWPAWGAMGARPR